MNRIQFGEGACEKIRQYLDSYVSNELLVETNHEVLRHLERVEAMRPRVLTAQLFGGVGTMAGFGEQALGGSEILIDRLPVGVPPRIAGSKEGEADDPGLPVAVEDLVELVLDQHREHVGCANAQDGKGHPSPVRRALSSRPPQRPWR